MKIKKHAEKPHKKGKAKTPRKATRKLQKTWHPSNYLLEPHPELGIPECEEDAHAYASPI
jgi:hypothetical protein